MKSLMWMVLLLAVNVIDFALIPVMTTAAGLDFVKAFVRARIPQVVAVKILVDGCICLKSYG